MPGDRWLSSHFSPDLALSEESPFWAAFNGTRAALSRTFPKWNEMANSLGVFLDFFSLEPTRRFGAQGEDFHPKGALRFLSRPDCGAPKIDHQPREREREKGFAGKILCVFQSNHEVGERKVIELLAFSAQQKGKTMRLSELLRISLLLLLLPVNWQASFSPSHKNAMTPLFFPLSVFPL